MSEGTYQGELGHQLRRRRKLLRLNQTEVADLAGTTQRSVSQVETGKATSIELYLSVAEVLGLRLTLEERTSDRTPPARGGPAA
jgi:transcriptional regulator with XRE-family HTH domain